MAEYIEREALMEDCKSMINEMWNSKTAPVSWAHAYAEFLDNVERVPTADVAPVVHGRWEYIPQTLNTLSQLRCPFCGWWSLDPSIDGGYNYCPNCGAKMDGE